VVVTLAASDGSVTIHPHFVPESNPT